jgi:hypothetical protein
MYVANGCSKMTVSSLTVTLHPDDGLLMPETRRGILIQQSKNKQCPHTYTLPPVDGLLMPETCRGILIH